MSHKKGATTTILQARDSLKDTSAFLEMLVIAKIHVFTCLLIKDELYGGSSNEKHK